MKFFIILSIGCSLIFLFLGCEVSNSNHSSPLLPLLQTELFLSNAKNPSISPNGQTIVFQRGNEFYVFYQNQELPILTSNDPFPTSEIRWVNDSVFVYSSSHLIGSVRNGLFHYSLNSRSLIQLHTSGRDPYPLTINHTSYLIYEETNPNYGYGLYLYNLQTHTTFSTGILGVRPTVSANHQYLTFFTGANGNLPAVTLLPNFGNSVVFHHTDTYHITFLNSEEIVFDTFEPSQNRNGQFNLYKYNLVTGVKTLWIENGSDPTSTMNNWLTYRAGTGNTAELVQYRNGTLYCVSHHSGKFTLFPNGRVLFEKENDLWISE